MPRVKVRVAGSGGIMGSTQKDALSVDLWIQEVMHMHGATQGCSIMYGTQICKKKNTYTGILYSGGAAQRSLVH